MTGINLRADHGEITCLLGPSGCGKTTLLRLTAGLLEVQKGAVSLDDKALATPGHNPPPEKRPVGLVFQEGALFPHMTVTDNVGFGLTSRADKAKVISELLDQVGLSELGGRYPHTLSGGQQQRVALVRALAPEPPVLLLDEPFANVDVVLRRQLREETRRILRARGAIAVLVTHDPEEALDVADRIAVMGQGKIVQADTPDRLYDAPQSAEVAMLFGHGQPFRVRCSSSGAETPFGLWPATAFAGGLPEARTIDMVIRPEALRLQDGQGATVEDVRPQGPNQRIILIAPSGERVTALIPKDEGIDAGQSVAITPLPRSLFAFPA
ncbi:MAG: ABC transporter ATP-binding protein [Pseudomonadota bacterium]